MMICILLLSIISFSCFAVDDSEHNSIARNLKQTVMKRVTQSYDLEGFCDVYIHMRHQGKFAIVRTVKTTGNHKLCKLSRKAIKVGRKFSYVHPEKIIRLHILP